MRFWMIISVCAVMLLSCVEKKSNSSTGNVGNQGKADDNIVAYADFTLQVPATWTELASSSSPNRLVEFAIPGSKESRVVGYFFGPTQLSQDEMIQSNLDRWEKQFAKIETRDKINLQAKDLVCMHYTGVFLKKPFPMAPEGTETPGYAVLTAIVPSPEGPYYFRLEATIAIVKEEKDNFVSFLNSYRKK